LNGNAIAPSVPARLQDNRAKEEQPDQGGDAMLSASGPRDRSALEGNSLIAGSEPTTGEVVRRRCILILVPHLSE
jgi:hypothetical protein